MKKSYIRSKKRVKDHGEVFTPEHIVKEMIALIDDSVWSDPTKIVLEPSCGNGNFVIEVIKKKISCGSTPLEAVRTTFGIDISSRNIKETRQRIIEEIRNKVDEKELKKIIRIINYNIYKVKDTLKCLKEIEEKPLYGDYRYAKI